MKVSAYSWERILREYNASGNRKFLYHFTPKKKKKPNKQIKEKKERKKKSLDILVWELLEHSACREMFYYEEALDEG